MSPCQDCWSEDVLVQRLEVLCLARTLKEACELPYSTALQSFLGVFEVDGLQLKIQNVQSQWLEGLHKWQLTRVMHCAGICAERGAQ